jgi:hypothetical protein
MGIGLGIGINRSNYAQGIFGAYQSRVIADGGVTEAGGCVDAVSSLLQSASLLLIPSGYKGGKAYAQIPTNGNGDLTWTRASDANRTNSSGNIELMASGVPRLSYMYGSCPALLLEPQRTNSIRNSTMVGAVAGSPGTLPTNWIVGGSGGLTQTIVGLGTENGLQYMDVRFNGTAAGVQLLVSSEGTAQIVASNGQTWTNSFYFKSIEAPTPPNSYNLFTIQRVSGVSGGAFTQAFTPTSTLARYAQTSTLTNALTTHVQPYFLGSLTIGATYDFTIRIAAPQMELGAYATTFIPTTTASATRVADSFSRNNIYTNGLITSSGGTWFVELRGNVAYTRDGTANAIGIGDSNTLLTNSFIIRNSSSTASRFGIVKRVGGTLSVLFTTTTDTVKIAIKWNGSTADVFVNGTKQVSATAFTATNMEFLQGDGSQQPAFIQAMALYPTPLSDTDCTTITTL